MRIVIFVYRKESEEYLRQEDWMESHPLGGMEASAMRMAKALRALGHDAIATTQVEELRKRPDVFISARGWQLFAKKLRPGRQNYLWCHDDANQPVVTELANPSIAASVYATVDGVMMLSEYQTQRWHKRLNLDLSKVFRCSNGIPCDKFLGTALPLEGRGPLAYYGSTPFRGLEHAVKRWPSVRNRVPGAELHIFSSMQIYGVPEAPEFNALYETARKTPGIVYHGAQGQEEIRKTSRLCRALAYPCIFPETSCITAMEAMASGCVIVSRAIGALPETAKGNPLVPDTPDWLDRWEDALVRVLSDDSQYLPIARENLRQIPSLDWKYVAQQWIEHFTRRQAAQGSLGFSA
jgi:glycosyltransferase involved in cell wall biosynthesis